MWETITIGSHEFVVCKNAVYALDNLKMGTAVSINSITPLAVHKNGNVTIRGGKMITPLRDVEKYEQIFAESETALQIRSVWSTKRLTVN